MARRVRSQGKIARSLLRAERAVVGGFMRLIAIVAERRVKRGLEEAGTKPHGKSAVHVDLEERISKPR
ncbi:MAG: hypothetical protein ABR548_04310 [Actinomycetota bacterium]|nr:hypothetical protein [Actinomycetota bacterium]